MKSKMTTLYTLLKKKDAVLGLCALDLLKYALLACAFCGLILLLTRVLGFAAAFAATVCCAAMIAAGICFCLGE